MTEHLPQQAAGHPLALPSSDLAETIRQKLIDDFGMVQVDRHGQERIYRPRLELLAEAVTPKTWSMTMDWLSSTRRGSLNTKRSYADDIIRVWAPYARTLGYERFFLGCFTAGHIRSWRLGMEADNRARSTIARYLNTISSLHTYAAQYMDLPRNPVTQDDRPKVEKGNNSTSTPVLEIEEIQALAAGSRDGFDLLVVSLLYTLAGRVSEMCSADVSDRVERGRRSFLDVTRKEYKERILPLPLTVAELLDTHTADRTEGPLLLDREGGRLDRHDVARMLTRIGRRARTLTCSKVDEKKHSFAKCKSCRDVTPHVLRASRITHMLDAEVPLAEVQAFADHDNPATTVGYWERRGKNERNIKHVDDGEALFTNITRSWKK